VSLKKLKNKTILITGAVGFIGSNLVNSLIKSDFTIIGIDNHNHFYDLGLKKLRLENLCEHKNYLHHKVDIASYNELNDIFIKYKPKIVVNLAALAGVRYSVESPLSYIESNINGFANIIECARLHKVEHFIYASSSSVYGANAKIPFSVDQATDCPLNIYAATKKANELIAHSYSHLYQMRTTGLRFFTVYGPWGRPDMALFKFTRAINEGKPIQLYNNGLHSRDFTYIDDIVDGVLRVMNHDRKNGDNGLAKILNIGRGSPISLMDFVGQIETVLNKKAIKEFLPPQDGDMFETYADISPAKNSYGYDPKFDYKVGVKNFVEWYLKYINQISGE
jgi:UDP-glucuronate 4-epimerase